MTELSELNGVDFGAVWVVSIALLFFGIAYNSLINHLHKKGYNDGKTWLEVVVGVGVVVLASIYTLGAGGALILTFHFAAAGLAMSLGDIWRHVKAQEREAKERAEQ